MFPLNSRSYRLLIAALVYIIAIASALTLATYRSRAGTNSGSTLEAPTMIPEARVSSKPFFSLASHRTYGTGENARLWVDYQSVDHLDFRVYRIKDPLKFFTQLNNPHQMGEREKEDLAGSLPRRQSVLERIRTVKHWAYEGIKSYLRDQLQHDGRKSFNHKFRGEDTPSRVPLNVADYARVPLLNANQLVSSWREPLFPLESQYDRRMVPLGKRDPGAYLVEAVGGDLRAYTVVVITDLTMIDKTSRDGDLLLYTADRKTGEPRSGAAVQIVQDKKTIASGVTDGQGLFRTKISRETLNAEDAESDPATDGVQSGSRLILASQHDNFAISDLDSFNFSGFENNEDQEHVKGYIYTDRPVYRPAHKVYFKGILRAVDEHGGYARLNDATVNVTIEDPNGAKVFDRDLPYSQRGTFNGEIEISAEAPLGTYQISAHVGAGTSGGSFEVAEYKKPEYKVSVSVPGRFIQAGEKMKFSVDANYFFGAPVANAEAKYYIYRSRYYAGYFDNTEDDENSDDSNGGDEFSSYYGYGSEMIQDSEGKLDAHGHMDIEFQVPVAEETDATDYSYRLEAQITDSSRRTIDSTASFVATRGNIVVHANPDRYLYNKGDLAKVHVTTSDYEGRAVSAKVQLELVERTWSRIEKGQDGSTSPDYEMHERIISSGFVETDSQGLAGYDYLTSSPGTLLIKTIVTERGKAVMSIGGYLWVTDRGYEWSDSSYYSEDYSSIKLIPDKKSYRPGETAHVLAILPTSNTHLLVSTELSAVMSARTVSAPGNSLVLDVPIEASYAPNVFLNVTYLKDGDMYTSDKRLIVPATDKMLSLEIISNKKEYKPRETAAYTILARNAEGAPVPGAEVSLGVVDEAVYSIAPDSAGSIRNEFYGLRYNSVETHLSISYVFTGYAGDKPMELARNRPAYQLADFKNEGDLVEPAIRRRFKDTASWQPAVITGADGRATVTVKLPDNLTTWRATARGITSDTKVGATKYTVVARKDVIMRLETPRFITEGDVVTLSGIVHNYLNSSKTTHISLDVDGAQLLSPAKQTVTIAKQGEHRLDWQIAASQVGQIKLLAKALTDTESDAVEIPLEVIPRGLHQVKSETWTSADENAEKTFAVNLPANADARARKLRIEASPSIAGTLFGALDYLTTYPYGCTEQTMSSFLPNVIVTQVLKEVKSASIANSNDLPRKVQRGMDRLYGFQHNDGGWGWWKNDQSDPFMTAYVVDGLTLAKQAGYQTDESRLERGRAKLKEMLDSGKTEAGTAIDNETRAFMVFALTESGSADAQYVEQLFAQRGSLQPYGRALLALILKYRQDERRAQEVTTEIERTAIGDALTVHWESQRKPMLDFSEDNEVEATSLSLKALTRIRPGSPLLARVARWLVSHRRNSYYWDSTKDTAFAIFGLIDYLKVSRELSPDYDFEIYVNEKLVLKQHVTSAEASRTFITSIAGDGISEANRVRVVKRGAGTLYFNTSLDFYTGEESVVAQGSSDLNLTREYLRLRVVADGYKLKWSLEPLTGEIRSGDLLVVRLRVNGLKARHLMIEDPIPAGAEQIENVGDLDLDYTAAGRWTDWYSSREFRDQRTVFFLDYFGGEATFQYAMRVQVPGEFRIAPARAELMYQPATQANTESRKMLFLER